MNHDVAGLQVLVVDDQTDSRVLAGRLLESRGAVVTTADSATAALEATGSRRFDVIVSDIGMPERDGYWLIRQLRSREPTRETPAVALTAYVREDDRNGVLRAGFDRHCAKPIEPSELLRAVSILGGRTPAEDGGTAADRPD